MNKKDRAKRILSVGLCCCFAFSAMTACNDKKQSANDGKVTITLGDSPDETTNPKVYEIYEKNIASFEERYPNAKIEMDTYTYSPDSYMAKAEADTLPTLYNVPLTEGRKIMDMGYAAEVTDEFKARGFYDNINSFMLENISRDGKIYFVPDYCYDVGLLVNIDLLDRAGYIAEDGTPHEPQTWEELAEMAVKIKEVTGKAGFALPTINNLGGWRFTPIAWSFGVEFMKQDSDGKWQATFDSPECVQALQFVKDLKWKYDVLPANTLLDSNEVNKQMGTGECAMTLSEVNMVHSMTKFAGSPDAIGAVKIPSGPKRRVSLMGGAYKVINKNATPEQKKVAMDWLEANGTTMKLNDAVKQSVQNSIESNLKLNQMIGIKSLSPWKGNSEVDEYRNAENEKHININMNHIKLYNDKSGVEYQSEEPVEAQALYSLLDGCVQEVLNNENADCAALIKKAAKDFQKNYLD